MKIISSGVAASIAAAALVSLAPAAHAADGQTVMIRPGDFVSVLSDTRATGHVDFLKEGLHVWTEGTTSTDKAAEYFAVATQGLPSSASLTWWGTTPQPGSQLVFDADGSTATTDDAYNVLVGEPVYGDDFWMTSGSSFYKQHHDLCPETSGGSGSDCHGTLAEWKAALPDAQLYAAGFSLGSGVKGDGVLHDVRVGDTDYQFTDEASAPDVTVVPVTGSATVTRIDYRHATQLRMHFVTDALGANEQQGAKLTFKVTDNSSVVYRATMNADADAVVKLRFPEGSGKHKVQILKNGAVDQTFILHMGR
jgi:hypothetical protein